MEEYLKRQAENQQKKKVHQSIHENISACDPSLTKHQIANIINAMHLGAIKHVHIDYKEK